MPLTAPEKTEVAIALLRCFGEDYNNVGLVLKYLSRFTAGKVDLLAEVQTQALTWQPFIDSGLTIGWWNNELARVYNAVGNE